VSTERPAGQWRQARTHSATLDITHWRCLCQGANQTSLTSIDRWFFTAQLNTTTAGANYNFFFFFF
jgi:hypothetical protein